MLKNELHLMMISYTMPCSFYKLFQLKAHYCMNLCSNGLFCLLCICHLCVSALHNSMQSIFSPFYPVRILIGGNCHQVSRVPTKYKTNTIHSNSQMSDSEGQGATACYNDPLLLASSSISWGWARPCRAQVFYSHRRGTEAHSHGIWPILLRHHFHGNAR